MKKYAIIGDIHAELNQLLKMIEKIKEEKAEPIFVGDLVDRGKNSKEVVQFVIDNNYKCVMGNHEESMVDMYEILKFIKENGESKNFLDDIIRWVNVSGFDNTLESYGIAKVVFENNKKTELNLNLHDENFILFEKHINWIKKLPTYITLNDIHIKDKKVIISHSSISGVWDMKNLYSIEDFESNIRWNREKPKDIKGIYNIFGHSEIGSKSFFSNDGDFTSPMVTEYFTNVDTSCGKDGFLTSILIPEMKVIY